MFGRAVDPSGAVVTNATVTVTNPSTGVSRTVKTNESGEFVVPNLPPGNYSLKVEAPGFQTLTKTNLILNATDRLDAGELRLTVGDAGAEVTVTADTGQIELQSQSGERSDLITTRQIDRIALNGRNVLDLFRVMPGVVSDVQGAVSGRGGLDQFNINGSRGNQKQFTIDGTSNVDTGNNGAVHVTVNPDAIAEVKVLTSNYQAEYGKAAGGFIALVTKSGTNDFHGDARWFHRHEGLNANNWFSNHKNQEIAKYRYNYFGWNLGGPVIIPGTDFNRNRDKLFFFWSEEFYRQLIPAGNPVQGRVPTLAELSGDFSQSYYFDGDTPTPFTLIDPVTGQPFPNNQIPSNRILPGAQAWLRRILPSPNLTGDPRNNYISQLSGEYPRREDIFRLDYQVSNAHRLYSRFINNDGEQTLPYGAGPWGIAALGLPGGVVFTEPSWNFSLNLTSTLSPTMVNEFTFGPSVAKLDINAPGGQLTRTNNPDINIPLLFSPDANGPIPDLSLGGIPGIGDLWTYAGAVPFTNSNTTIDVADNLTKVFGSHTAKFGVFFQRNRKDQDAWGNANGNFSFRDNPTDPIFTGNPIANALLGYYETFQQTNVRPRGAYRYSQLEFYAQDTWRVTPTFTLDAGMRFSWFQPQYDEKLQGAYFNPALYDPANAVRLFVSDGQGNAIDPANPSTVFPGDYVGAIVPGSGRAGNGMGVASAGYFRSGIDDRGVQYEPRIGFAWNMFGNQKTVLRGGAGIFHDRIQGNLIYNAINENPPNVVAPTYLRGNVANIPSLANQAGIVAPANALGVDPGGYVPTIYNFSLGIQRSLPGQITLDVSYVGSQSRHLVRTRNLNALPYGTLFTRAAQDPSKFPGGVVPAVEPNLPPAYANAGFSFSGAYAYDNPNYLRPYKGYQRIQYYTFDGNSNYNSLQVSANRRFGNNLTFGVAYTFSKTLVTANGDEDWINPTGDPRYDYRLASWDRPHVLAINYVVDLPKFSRTFDWPDWVGKITDGFQLSGITQVMSGAPIEPEIWWPAHQVTGSPSYPEWNQVPLRPILVGDPNDGTGNGRSGSLFNPAAFAAPPIGVPPYWPRTYLRGGGMWNFDMSLFKNIPFSKTEGRYIQLRLEAFNVFNHPNFRNVNIGLGEVNVDGTTGTSLTPRTTRPAGSTDPVGSYFGEYTDTYNGTGGPRVVQLGLKVYF